MGPFPDSDNGILETGSGPGCCPWAGDTDGTQSLGEGLAGDGTRWSGGGVGKSVGMKLVGELVAFLFDGPILWVQ